MKGPIFRLAGFGWENFRNTWISLLTVGDADLSRTLDALWHRTKPAENAAEETARVAAHLRVHYHQVGLVNDVLDYELALHRCARQPHGNTGSRSATTPSKSSANSARAVCPTASHRTRT
jgi:hypothetical protein